MKSFLSCKHLSGIKLLSVILMLSLSQFSKAEGSYKELLLQSDAKLKSIKSPQEGLEYWQSLSPKLSGKDGRYEYELGNLYYRLGHSDEALSAYFESTKLDSTFPYPFMGIARIGIDRHDYKSAASLINKVTSAYPDWYKGFLLLADLHFQQEEYKQAAAAAAVSLKKKETGEGYALLSKAYYSMGEYETAYKAAMLAHKTNAEYKSDLNLSSVVLSSLMALGMKDKAQAFLESQKSSLSKTTIEQLKIEHHLD